MSTFLKKKISYFAVTAVVLTLAGCGSSTNQQVSSNSQSTISGVVAANYVKGATVNLYALTQNGVQAGLIGSGVTDANGNFNVSINGATTLGGGILAIASGGTYIDETTKKTLVLDSMRAVTTNLGTQTLNITPMSGAVWIMAQNLLNQDGLENAVAISQATATKFFGFNLNSPISSSLKTAVSSGNCAQIGMNSALSAISTYQNSVATTQSTLNTSAGSYQLASEMSANMPASSLSSQATPIATSFTAIYSGSCANSDANSSCSLSATNFATQLAVTPFSSSNTQWSGATWGPNVANYTQQTCPSQAWQTTRVMYAYENIAVPSLWNYCHHHSPNWFPGSAYSINQTSGESTNSSTDALSLYCSPLSFYASGQSASNLNFRTQSSLITSAYRWNSAYAQKNVPNWSSLVSVETNSSAQMSSLLSALYSTQGIDSSWYGFSELNSSSPNLYINTTPQANNLYPRQASNQALNGVDCSDLTAWAYNISLNTPFTSMVNWQAGQPTSGTYANATANYLCANPTNQNSGSAGSFVVYNGAVIDHTAISNNKNSAVLNQLQAGDLLFIQSTDSNGSLSGSVSHVITWTAKTVGAAGSGVTATTVGLDLIAPSSPSEGQTRTIGDWVIIDSHYQGADYRAFSGWYVSALWGVRRVINPQNQICGQ